MKNTFFKQLIKLLCLLLLALNVFSGGNESDSLLMESLDEVLIEEYKPCSDQSDISSLEVNIISSLMIVSEDSSFAEGEVITSASGVQAIVDSYDVETQKLTYHQDANTGFETFLLNETITGASSEIAIVKEFIIDLTIPCSELIVSIEEEPQQMIFTPKESTEEAKLAAEKAAAEMMAEIEEELARQAALEAFQKKLADEKAAAAASTAAYQSKLAYDAKVEELMEALAIEQEIAAFEAKLAAEKAAAEMMAEIEEELARKAALEAFQKKLAEEKIHLQQILADKKNIVLHADLEEVPEFYFDANRMGQVVDNLLSNAVKYSPPDKEIFIKLVSNEETMTLSVKDEGPGISLDEQGQLFQHFKKLSARPTGGESSSGLGLAIAQRIVEEHQGDIGVDSQLGHGATFHFSLPTRRQRAAGLNLQ